MSNIQKIAMGCKPDPYKFLIHDLEVINGNTVILANYEGCLSFGGQKLMLLRGDFSNWTSETLDPHFLDEEYPVVARFIPNEMGIKLAKICAENL